MKISRPGRIHALLTSAAVLAVAILAVGTASAAPAAQAASKAAPAGFRGSYPADPYQPLDACEIQVLLSVSVPVGTVCANTQIEVAHGNPRSESGRTDPYM